MEAKIRCASRSDARIPHSTYESLARIYVRDIQKSVGQMLKDRVGIFLQDSC
jgi:hypothetical protein